MVLWQIMSLLDEFDPQNIEVSKIMRDIMTFLSKEKYPISFFLSLFLHVILHKNK